jgi:hypothetical protein
MKMEMPAEPEIEGDVEEIVAEAAITEARSSGSADGPCPLPRQKNFQGCA